MICSFHTCSVCQCEENEIPLPWKQDSQNDDIDKKIDEKFYQWVDKYNYSSNQWLVENEIDSKNGIYVNLEKNPEAFTGYQGQHIWNAIYHENCFSGMFDQLCTEEKVFYKVVSGLHSNINLHLSKNYLDIEKNVTYFNTTMMNDRLLKHKDRINNLFFLHSVLVNAFYKAKDLFKNYEIYTGNTEEDAKTHKLLKRLIDLDDVHKKYYDGIKNSENYKKFLKFEKLDQIKMRFRNISSIMDCVSCQKCKLHGKLQIYGLATMLKILFSNENNLKLKRNEFISFVNVVGKVSRSIRYLTDYIDTIRNDTHNIAIIYVSLMIILFVLSIYINIKYLSNREKYDRSYKLLMEKSRAKEKEKQQLFGTQEVVSGTNVIIDNKKTQ